MSTEHKNNPIKRICVGLLAHVDAGKTTLTEALLYTGGKLRAPGRVDRGDAFLDTDPMEKERGITIFAKQAELLLGNTELTLLDTPGHPDLVAETAAVLPALDYAILILSGTDGVTTHSETLWKLLRKARIPTFLFVNKTDLPGTDQERVLQEIREKLTDSCVDFTAAKDAVLSAPPEVLEACAMCDEALLERYLSDGTVTAADLRSLIREEKLFPCWFGSALKLAGIDTFLAGISALMEAPAYGGIFSARVFKIARDPQGKRLSFLRITGGTLRVRDQIGKEKIDQIRVYDGARFTAPAELGAGTVCAVTGLSHTYPGMILGVDQAGGETDILRPFDGTLCRVIFPEGTDLHKAWLDVKMLSEETPGLCAERDELNGVIRVRLHGALQQEILRKRFAERFHIWIDFGEESVFAAAEEEERREEAERLAELFPPEEEAPEPLSPEEREAVMLREAERLQLRHERLEKQGGAAGSNTASSPGDSYEADQELLEIFRRTYKGREEPDSRKERDLLRPGIKAQGKNGAGEKALLDDAEPWLLVDGYNVIFASEELKGLAKLNIDAARARLLELLSDFQAYRGLQVLVVFDAYKVSGRNNSEVERFHKLYVVYTKQAETADQYIAKAVQRIGGRYRVTVASSDALVQLIILGQGALRISSRELLLEMAAAREEMRRDYLERPTRIENRVLPENQNGA